jgi:hypothetical protein
VADEMSVQGRLYSVKCKYCDILLVGREQFIGHMIHSHEIEYGRLDEIWQSLNTGLLK